MRFKDYIEYCKYHKLDSYFWILNYRDKIGVLVFLLRQDLSN